MHTAAGLHDWPRIWLFPAVIAALISVLFLFSFRNVVVAYERPGVDATFIPHLDALLIRT